jgi:hypothetical protein
MKNEPGKGPTEQNKAMERMAQERGSPGATSAGGDGANAPDNDTRKMKDSLKDAGAPDTSANTGARRGDRAANPKKA